MSLVEQRILPCDFDIPSVASALDDDFDVASMASALDLFVMMKQIFDTIQGGSFFCICLMGNAIE